MTAIYQSRTRANESAAKIKIFAQAQRLMILSYLLTGEHSVGDIEGATKIRQPALSQQLAVLRRSGLVQTRRSMKEIYYRLASDEVSIGVRGVETIFCGGNASGLDDVEANHARRISAAAIVPRLSPS